MNQVSSAANVYESEIGEVIPDVPAPPAPPAVAAEYTAEHMAAQYNAYCIDTDYQTDSGLRVLPTSRVNGKAVLVRVHGGLTASIVKGTSERAGEKPRIPNFHTGDNNRVPVTQSLTLCNALKTGNGNDVYRASFVQKYFHLTPKTPSSTYPIGAAPAETITAQSQYYAPSDFTISILDGAFASDDGAAAPLETVIRVGS